MTASPAPEPGGTRRAVQRVLPAEPHGPTLAWWGTLLGVIAYGMALAAVLFAYAYLGALAGGWPPTDAQRPALAQPTAATAVLVAAVVPAALLQRAAKRGASGLLQSSAAALPLVGALHLVLQGLTYTDLPMPPTEGAYGSVFLLTLILHHLGLFGGMVGGLILALQVWDEAGERARGTAMALGLWWYGMVGYWLLVYATLYVSPLVFGGGG